jgi:hypothetical protein
MVQAGDTTTTIAAALVTPIKANSTFYTTPSGGYGSGAIFAYVSSANNQIYADFNAQWTTTWQYTASGSSTETITSSSGWLTNAIFCGGTTSGSANAQTITIGGATAGTGGPCPVGSSRMKSILRFALLLKLLPAVIVKHNVSAAYDAVESMLQSCDLGGGGEMQCAPEGQS